MLYDADCGFCKWTLSLLLRWDRAARLAPVALQRPEAADLLVELTPARALYACIGVGSAARVLHWRPISRRIRGYTTRRRNGAIAAM